MATKSVTTAHGTVTIEAGVSDRILVVRKDGDKIGQISTPGTGAGESRRWGATARYASGRTMTFYHNTRKSAIEAIAKANALG